MASITITDTKLKGLKKISAFVAGDERGALVKTYEERQYKTYGLEFDTSEIMFSVSRGSKSSRTLPRYDVIFPQGSAQRPAFPNRGASG